MINNKGKILKSLFLKDPKHDIRSNGRKNIKNILLIDNPIFKNNKVSKNKDSKKRDGKK